MATKEQERQQQEYEFVMEGITTRMQIAMEKISESNRLLRSTVKSVCLVMLAVVIIVVSGFIVSNHLWFEHVYSYQQEDNVGTVSANETIPELGTGTAD